MMLDFFGMELKNEATGKLQRARNWRERMNHLNGFVMYIITCTSAMLAKQVLFLAASVCVSPS